MKLILNLDKGNWLLIFFISSSITRLSALQECFPSVDLSRSFQISRPPKYEELLSKIQKYYGNSFVLCYQIHKDQASILTRECSGLDRCSEYTWFYMATMTSTVHVF